VSTIHQLPEPSPKATKDANSPKIEGGGTPYARGALKRELSLFPATGVDGSGTHSVLYAAAVKMGNFGASGELEKQTALAALVNAAVNNGDGKLDETEALRVFNDGWTIGEENPRSTPEDKRRQTSPVNGENGGRPRANYLAWALKILKRDEQDGVPTLVSYQGDWYRFGGLWRKVPDVEVRGLIMDFIAFHDQTLANKSHCDNVVANLKTQNQCLIESHHSLPFWLDKRCEAPGWIATQSGLIEVRPLSEAARLGKMPPEPTPDGLWRPLSPRLLTPWTLPYAFDPKAGCPRWRKFVEEVQPSPEGQRFLQVMFGLTLVPDTSFEVFFHFFGPAGTGKSTALRVLEELVGSENTCVVPLEKFAEKFSTVLLTEKLVNISNEMPSHLDSHTLAGIEGRLRSAASGNTIDTERKFKEPGKARVTARSFFATNALPLIQDKTSAFWDRWRIVPFDVCFRDSDKRDRDLSKTLASELPGILNWALEGLGILLSQSHFPEHPDGEKIKEEHRRRCDPVQVFLEETITHCLSQFVETGRLFARYQTWCDENNYRPFCRDNFTQAVERILKVRQSRRQRGNLRERGFENWAWGGNTGNDDGNTESSSSEPQKPSQAVGSEGVLPGPTASETALSKPNPNLLKLGFPHGNSGGGRAGQPRSKTDASATATEKAMVGLPDASLSTANTPEDPPRSTPDSTSEALPPGTPNPPELATSPEPLDNSPQPRKKYSRFGSREAERQARLDKINGVHPRTFTPPSPAQEDELEY
jgi:P4 family phage/plasmid primase-like protien